MRPFIAILSLFLVSPASAGHLIPADQPYKFGYQSLDEAGNAQSRHEESLGDTTKGSYSLRDSSTGHFRRVNYIADRHGFRAWVDTNEAGTLDSAPAAAQFFKNPEVPAVAGPAASTSSAVVPLAPKVLGASHLSHDIIAPSSHLPQSQQPLLSAYSKPVLRSLPLLVAASSPATAAVKSTPLISSSSEQSLSLPHTSSGPSLFSKFADTFRRRRPIKTIGNREIFVEPVNVPVNGVPVYKDK